MIRSYGDKDTERLAQGQRVRRFAAFERLELLKGDRAGTYSIRINDQWRIVFRWIDNHAERVTIEDYH